MQEKSVQYPDKEVNGSGKRKNAKQILEHQRTQLIDYIKSL